MRDTNDGALPGDKNRRRDPDAHQIIRTVTSIVAMTVALLRWLGIHP